MPFDEAYSHDDSGLESDAVSADAADTDRGRRILFGERSEMLYDESSAVRIVTLRREDGPSVDCAVDSGRTDIGGVSRTASIPFETWTRMSRGADTDVRGRWTRVSRGGGHSCPPYNKRDNKPYNQSDRTE